MPPAKYSIFVFLNGKILTNLIIIKILSHLLIIKSKMRPLLREFNDILRVFLDLISSKALRGYPKILRSLVSTQRAIADLLT